MSEISADSTLSGGLYLGPREPFSAQSILEFFESIFSMKRSSHKEILSVLDN